MISALLLATLMPIDFPAPTPETKPWGICHCLGNAIEPSELEKEMTRWADAGLGGVRLIPIYGAKGYEPKYVEFMSPKYVELLKEANRIAADKGMKVDLSFGAGWCFGGKATPPELGAQGLKVLKPGDREPKRFKVLFEKDGTRLVAYPTGQKVKRAQALDAGPMLNPFSPAALKAHLTLFKNLDGVEEAYPRATFHDSFEYYNAGWSDEFPDLFKKYRGYDIMDHLAELAGFGEKDAIAKVKADYRETLSDILVKETFPIWTEWCKERGILTHNQAHGAPANLLEFYAIADTPETEMFGRGNRDKFTSCFDDRFKEGDRSILMSKFASSAAHLTGKKSTSAESFTWMAEHFCETLEETKAFGDLLFLSGVNRLYYHATVYSPDSAPWPGWCFYAASELNPRNPVWRDIKPLNDYFTRVQSFLAEAVPDNDVLLYWPINDQWTDPEGFESLMTVHAHWMEDIPFGKLAQRLWDGGWQFDYVSDSFLTDEIVSRYKAIVVPEAKVMKPEAIARLNELSKKMPVIFEKDGDAIEALKKTSAKPIAGLDGVEAIRFKWRGGSAYFAVNTSVVDSFLSIPEGTVLLHPLASDTDRRRRQFIPDDVGVTAMRLRPAQSVIMWMAEGSAPENVGIPAFSDEFGFARVKLGDWSLEFKSDVSGWELPPAHAKVTPGDWTKLGEKEAEFSGTAVYKTTFSLTKREAGRLSGIKLGDVAHTARVRVNGREIATLIMHPYMCDIPDGVLQDGVNTLEVEVTNLGANRIRAYDRKGIEWKTFEDANMASYRGKGLLDAKDWPVLPSGLMGPVKVLAYDPNPPKGEPAKIVRAAPPRKGAAKPSIVQRERWPDGFARSDWFADFSPVDESKLGKLYPAEEFGAKADESTMQTEALQGAIDKIASLGGGVLVLGPGTWNSSSLFFKPGVHMKLEKGAVLKGPADGKLAPRIPSRIEGLSVVYNAALVNADRCDGFTLYGEGTIDGNGKATWAAFWDGRKKEKGFKNTTLDRPRNVFVSNSKNVRVSGLSIKDSHFWTTHFHKCELVKLDNLRITAPGPENPPKAPSSDAIDLDVVADCHIWNTYMDVNDDGIALKGGKYYEAEKLPENGENVRILIENCTFGKVTHSAITCGSEALHCKNIVLRNCKLEGCGNLLNMKSRPDTKQLYEDILVENVTGECRNVVQAKPWGQYYSLPEGVERQKTEGRRITFRSCTVKGAINIKVDPEFMDFEEPVYENCKFD